MNDLFAALVLGIIEGITEFLPISSTGHLIVAADLLHFASAGGVFEIVIQLGAILALAWFYRADLWSRLRALPTSAAARRFWLNLFVAFLPVAVLGLLVGSAIAARLFSPVVVAGSFIVGGIILWLIDSRGSPAPTAERVIADLDTVTLRQALMIGVVQVAALIPGMSRSGASIVGGLLSGLDRATATTFSFYLALPTLGAATLYSLAKNINVISEAGALAPLALGTVAAFITALIAIGWLLRYVAHHSFRVFAVYRIVAGLLILLWVWLRA